MRLYTFGNYYLSSLQQGLQGTHVLGEIDVKYEKKPEQAKQVMEWKKHHKTMVMLNGGNAAQLAEIHEVFMKLRKRGMPYPFAKFHEDEQSLGGALTCVGIVLPEKVYDLAAQIRRCRNKDEADNYRKHLLLYNDIKQWMWDLAMETNKYQLAK